MLAPRRERLVDSVTGNCGLALPTSTRGSVVPHDNSVAHEPRRLSDGHLLALLRQEQAAGVQVAAEAAPGKTVPMDTFKWIVSGLLGALVVAVGWFLSGIQSDLRDVRKEVTGMRVDAAVTNTRLEELIAEFRRRNPR